MKVIRSNKGGEKLCYDGRIWKSKSTSSSIKRCEFSNDKIITDIDAISQVIGLYFAILSFRFYQDAINIRYNRVKCDESVLDGLDMRFLRAECVDNKHFGTACLGKCPITPKQVCCGIYLPSLAYSVAKRTGCLIKQTDLAAKPYTSDWFDPRHLICSTRSINQTPGVSKLGQHCLSVGYTTSVKPPVPG